MKKINKKNLKIIRELDVNSRQSSAKIARKVGLSEQVTSYRINQLLSTGVIERCYTLLNPAVIGYMHFKVYLRLQNVSLQLEREFINHLAANPYSFWVVSCRGRWDLIASFFAKDAKQFGKLFRKILNKYDRFILERNVVAVEEAPSFTRGYLAPEIEPKELAYGGEPPRVKLKEDEIKLLSLISQNSRISLTTLANDIGVTPEAVSYKLKALEKSGIITGYGIIPNLQRLGYEPYLISLTFNGLEEKSWKKIVGFCRQSRIVLFMPMCIGNHDLDIELEARNEEELNMFLDSLRNEFASILRDFETVHISKQHKFDYFPMARALLDAPA